MEAYYEKHMKAAEAMKLKAWLAQMLWAEAISKCECCRLMLFRSFNTSFPLRLIFVHSLRTFMTLYDPVTNLNLRQAEDSLGSFVTAETHPLLIQGESKVLRKYPGSKFCLYEVTKFVQVQGQEMMWEKTRSPQSPPRSTETLSLCRLTYYACYPHNMANPNHESTEHLDLHELTELTLLSLLDPVYTVYEFDQFGQFGMEIVLHCRPCSFRGRPAWERHPQEAARAFCGEK